MSQANVEIVRENFGRPVPALSYGARRSSNAGVSPMLARTTAPLAERSSPGGPVLLP
jgi:hypothetical protein